MLAEILREAAADHGGSVVSGACAPQAQAKLFKKVLRETGFPEDRFVPLDIRGTDNEGILTRLRRTVESLSKEETKPAA